ncbi:hypothetical protein KC342_g46 [Hortaea werneckii]|nr:hypothetical protein KC342_g46 [Hortaea werneckii]
MYLQIPHHEKATERASAPKHCLGGASPFASSFQLFVTFAHILSRQLNVCLLEHLVVLFCQKLLLLLVELLGILGSIGRVHGSIGEL